MWLYVCVPVSTALVDTLSKLHAMRFWEIRGSQSTGSQVLGERVGRCFMNRPVSSNSQVHEYVCTGRRKSSLIVLASLTSRRCLSSWFMEVIGLTSPTHSLTQNTENQPGSFNRTPKLWRRATDIQLLWFASIRYFRIGEAKKLSRSCEQWVCTKCLLMCYKD